MLGKNEAVQRWLALWNGDIDQLSSLVADTVVTHAVLVVAVTDEPLVGREALCAWIIATHAAMPGLRFSIEIGPLADGDLIAMRWRPRTAGSGSAELHGNRHPADQRRSGR